MKRICVFCGASAGNRPAYRHAAETLGRALAERGIGLVYGGGKGGLMGAVADACLAANCEVKCCACSMVCWNNHFTG